jgi:hypothetical protein
VTSDTGILAPPGDVDVLEASLRRLISDRSERERLGARGPARAAVLCDPAQQLRKLAGFFSDFGRTAA